jgi:GNAT superfamily N-acetyltransferase
LVPLVNLVVQEVLLIIRPGKISDVPRIAQVYVDSWNSTYAGLVPDYFLKGMTLEAALKIFTESFQTNTHLYNLFVAETPEGRIVGFADWGRERSHPEQGIGELYGIYLLKEFQRQGIGEKLFIVARESLVAQGIRSMVVWVLDKSPYRKFYEKTQGVLQPGTKQLGRPGESVSLVSYKWDI